ncbi:hypothetical protein [Rhizobium lusitanum]|uniref:hypothetical protein n=1 Tax=Rhizobium lusitanum TaxID=293958 RepID=UPI0025722F44|nr:hypothetical protein [Rhizobium lusitanum]
MSTLANLQEKLVAAIVDDQTGSRERPIIDAPRLDADPIGILPPAKHITSAPPSFLSGCNAIG